MATEKRYEMLWDCPRCETPKLLGLSHRNGPTCGAPQDPTKRYFPKDEDKVAVEDHPFVHGRAVEEIEEVGGEFAGLDGDRARDHVCLKGISDRHHSAAPRSTKQPAETMPKPAAKTFRARRSATVSPGAPTAHCCLRSGQPGAGWPARCILPSSDFNQLPPRSPQSRFLSGGKLPAMA